jgi:mono/diheme cytochrome c family protein
MSRSMTASLLLMILGLTACSDPLQDQPAVHAHERPLLSVPAGVVPTTEVAGRRQTADVEPALTLAEAEALTNPTKADRASLQRGKVAYDRYCGHCHGDLGYGWTSVGSSFDPAPPDLVEATSDWSDGQVFGTITFGSNRCPALGYMVSVDDRWQIVSFIRTLPRARDRAPTKGPHWDQDILRHQRSGDND